MGFRPDRAPVGAPDQGGPGSQEGQSGSGHHGGAVAPGEGGGGLGGPPARSNSLQPPEPRWLAAMPPRMATLRACPVTRMVPRKALATLSWERSTLPMMALVLGALNAAMPTPTVARAAAMGSMDPPWPWRASRTIPRDVSSMPEVLRTREPTRSLRRPAKGLRQACMSGCPSMIQPVTFADRPCTSWRWTAVRMAMA